MRREKERNETHGRTRKRLAEVKAARGNLLLVGHRNNDAGGWQLPFNGRRISVRSKVGRMMMTVIGGV